MKSRLAVIVPAVVVIILALSLSLFLWSSDQNPTTPPASLKQQENKIRLVLSFTGGSSMFEHIELVESTDSDGNPYYVGKIDPELEDILPHLVDAYNADTTTVNPVSEDEVRLALTEEIVATTENYYDHNSFEDFLRWCGKKVTLVDAEGEKVDISSVTNIGYLWSREFYDEMGVYIAQ